MARTVLRQWGIGLVGAAISGAANGVTVMIVDPLRFNLFDGGAKNLASVVLVSAIVGAALYLKQHELPVEDDDENVRNHTRARRAARHDRERADGPG